MRKKGFFITFEGPEGSGKTTQANLLYQYLLSLGYPVILTREPGGTSIGERIRAILHDPACSEMLPTTEILLYSASRAQIVGQVIKPALDEGKIVICDRYADSTMAYQGYGHGLDLEVLRLITAFATGGLSPDLTFYLDLEVEEGLKRKRKAFERGESEWTRMDQKELAFHRRVRQGYLELASLEPSRWIILNALEPVETIQARIRSIVEERLREVDIGHRQQN